MQQLEAIRKQNFIEQRGKPPPYQQHYARKEQQPGVKPDLRAVGDPRYDPEARKKKIEALKVRKIHFMIAVIMLSILLDDFFSRPLCD